LEFIGTTKQQPAKLLYDTTVYIDILQGRFPQHGEAMLRATETWHSPVTEAELAATCGLLDPAHSRTREIVEQVAAVIDRRPSYRTITPDAEIWRGGWNTVGYAGPDPGIPKRASPSRLE
jgi:predicted nucleic acid-binding protein